MHFYINAYINRPGLACLVTVLVTTTDGSGRVSRWAVSRPGCGTCETNTATTTTTLPAAAAATTSSDLNAVQETRVHVE